VHCSEGNDARSESRGGSRTRILERAVTNSFSRAFVVAAVLGLAALAPILLSRRET
jgi:hypothetical protein